MLPLLQAFKNYDEAGVVRRVQCLKYLVLASMLMGSQVRMLLLPLPLSSGLQWPGSVFMGDWETSIIKPGCPMSLPAMAWTDLG